MFGHIEHFHWALLDLTLKYDILCYGLHDSMSVIPIAFYMQHFYLKTHRFRCVCVYDLHDNDDSMTKTYRFENVKNELLRKLFVFGARVNATKAEGYLGLYILIYSQGLISATPPCCGLCNKGNVLRWQCWDTNRNSRSRSTVLNEYPSSERNNIRPWLCLTVFLRSRQAKTFTMLKFSTLIIQYSGTT